MSLLKAIVNTKNTVAIMADRLTHILGAISSTHMHLHEGHHFYAKNWVDVTQGTPLDILMRVPPGVEELPHLLIFQKVAAEFELEWFDGPTVSANGAAIDAWNNNESFQLTDLPNLEIYTGPTITDVGTSRWKGKVGIDGGFFSAGGGAGRSEAEVVLIPGLYLLRVSKVSAGTEYFDYFFSWYEQKEED